MDQPEPKRPKYQRIADDLRAQIRSGEYGPGSRLPAETVLMRRFRVALPTLRQAVGLLRAEGLVDSRQGIGTFVREDSRRQRRSRHRYGSAPGPAGPPGIQLRHDVTFAGREPVSAHVAEIMGLEPGSEVVTRRRRLYDRETGRLEEIAASHLPLAVADGTYLAEPAVVPQALFRCVEELTGRRYTTARDQWIARAATAPEAAAFALLAGSPVLNLVHAARDEHGDILEVSESTWPADRILLVDEYAIDP